MDYYKIGQRIRKFRKAKGLSQEQLAERVNISVPHMSHIETGNTKLSLPVLVEIAESLEVSTDSLLYEQTPLNARMLGDIQETLDRCSAQELQIVLEIIRAIKTALDKYK